MLDSQLSRNQAEVERSALEARKIELKPLSRIDIDRYRNPRPDTPFALEYAFHLLGDVRGKTVVDLGCGTGENVVVLVERGARVTGMDISPDLIAISQKRVRDANLDALLKVGDACNTGLPDESVDVVFSIALIHHLDIKLVRNEMWRILRKEGVVILKEPIRFSKLYDRMRRLLPSHGEVSEYEHPLTREELTAMMEPFKAEGTRYFRLPIVPLVSRLLPSKTDDAWRASKWMIQHFPPLERYATGVVTRLQKL